MAIADVVICGAGIAGVSTAYQLARQAGFDKVVLVDERAPLSLTSDKSTEAYRNWWPGPGNDMVTMMNRSIDLMEIMAEESGNAFHMNHRGYLYVTTQPEQLNKLIRQAEEASKLGAGPIRVHSNTNGKTIYQPNLRDSEIESLSGVDIIEDQDVIQTHFPYLSNDVIAVVHVRRAGWLSAQQYGMYLLELARANDVELVNAKVNDVEIINGRVNSVQLNKGEQIYAPIFVNAAGPYLSEVADMLEINLPVFNELHLKASIEDSQKILPRNAPMIICADSQQLNWSDQERSLLANDPESSWLLDMLQAGAHTRPDGGDQANTILLLWDLNSGESKLEFPIAIDPMYAEIALRGLESIIPGFGEYIARMPQPYVDGGYYTKTAENRPIACPLPIEGAFVIGAMAGYGIMASAALSELVTAHITHSDLPTYESAFNLTRYKDPEYNLMLENWGESWQL